MDDHKINCFPVNTLCFSSRPSEFIEGKSRWVSGAFAENFINSTRFALFFDTFGQTILSNLKWMRLCDLELSKEDEAAFARSLNSFSQLERLDIIRARLNQKQDVVNLNLPMLTSLQLDEVEGIEKLILEAPRLRDVKLGNLGCYEWRLRVEIVPGESVERLLVRDLKCTEVKKLKNLQYLYVKFHPAIDPTLLSSLQQLKEIHLIFAQSFSELFEQKQLFGRDDLKIYLRGLFLNGPDDPAMNALERPHDHSPDYLSEEWLVSLAENPSRLADQIPFYYYLYYSAIESIATGLEVDLLKRFIHLNQVGVDRPVQDIQRFLDLLKNFENIVMLWFQCYQPQDLFDRLPEYCAVQSLIIDCPPSDLAFLFRMKHLTRLDLNWSIDIKTIRRAFEEFPALYDFVFKYSQKKASIKIGHPKEFEVSFGKMKSTMSDLNAAIEFIVKNERERQILKNRKNGVGSTCSNM